MKIVVRIQKMAGDQYLLGGKVFDSFLTARREMVELMRQRRLERRLDRISPGMQSIGA